MGNPSEYPVVFFFFFLKECCLGGWHSQNPGPNGRGVDNQLRPLEVITGHLFCSTTIQPCVFLLPLHVLRCLYFIWPNDVVMGCRFDLTSRQTCGTRKTLSNLWKQTRGACSKPLKHTLSGFISVGNQSLLI